MEHLLHLLACRFPLVLVIFVNRNPATAAISEPDPLELLLNFGAFLSGINDIFVRFYSRLLYFHLPAAPFWKVPVSNTNEPSATGPAETSYYVIECWDCRTKSNLATFSPVLVQHVESPASSRYGVFNSFKVFKITKITKTILTVERERDTKPTNVFNKTGERC